MRRKFVGAKRSRSKGREPESQLLDIGVGKSGPATRSEEVVMAMATVATQRDGRNPEKKRAMNNFLVFG